MKCNQCGTKHRRSDLTLMRRRLVCRECMCPEPDAEYLAREREFYTRRSCALGDAPDQSMVSYHERLLSPKEVDAAMKRIGMPVRDMRGVIDAGYKAAAAGERLRTIHPWPEN